MTGPSPESGRRRRRGAELEAALLEATWDELAQSGFASLTMESVAARAHTGIAVLYRRWANKGELVLAALEHYREVHPVEMPDSGTLRGDLIALLTAVARARAPFFATALAAGFSGLMSQAGLTPAQVRERLLGDAPRGHDHPVYRRAHDRGEIDLDHVSTAVLELPFDVVRNDMVMNLAPPSARRIRSIVDELFLPLVAAGAHDHVERR